MPAQQILNETEEAQQRSSVKVHVVHEAIRQQGDEELNRPTQALAWSGLAAGFSMGMSLIVEGLLRNYLPDAPWRSILLGFGYSFGYLMVIGGRQQLFTENTLSPIIPLLQRRDMCTFRKVAILWGTVLAANLAGAHIMAWVLSNTRAFTPEVQHSFQEIALQTISPPFAVILIRGIFAGWLLAMTVWIMAALDTSRLAVILIMTWVIGLGGFSHIIAGSAQALFLVWNGTISWWAFAGGYAAPALLGNAIGGVTLVAALNHAQVMAGKEEPVA